MRRFLSMTLSILLLGALAGCTTFSLNLNESDDQYSIADSAGGSEWFEGEILVGYDNRADLDRIAAAIGGQVTDTLDMIGAASISLPAGLSVPEAVMQLNFNQPQGLRFAEPSYIRGYIAPTPEGFSIDDTILASESATPAPAQAMTYNDPLRHQQWALDIMDADGAWQYATGRGVVVGVVDTGIDGSHPDLRGKQVPGMDCLTGNIIAPDEDFSQTNIHGTHVAGIVLASGNNNEGIVGVAPEAQLMSLVIFNDLMVGPGNGSGYVGDLNVARCVMWGSLIGGDGIPNSGDEAKVLNNSWGGRGYGHLLKAAIDEVVAAGTVFANSMGNSSHDEVLYPKAFPGVMGVGAMDPKDEKVGFSTMGHNLSVGAPGIDIISTWPMWHRAPNGQPYAYQHISGTSMAVPQVSGALALLFEKFPDATPYQLQKLLEDTADDTEAPGYDRRTGWGRINLTRALQAASLPADGSAVMVSVHTGNVADTDDNGVIDFNDTRVGVPITDVILSQHGEVIQFAQTNAQGEALFLNLPPGSYDVQVAGGDTILHNFRSANRITQHSSVSVSSGGMAEVNMEFNTQLKITMQWTGDGDVDLVVGEPSAAGIEWVSEKSSSSNWGAFALTTTSNGSNQEIYTLDEDHYPFATYPLALSAENANGPVDVTVTIEQNGAIETYGPYVLQPGEMLYSSEWYDWWENFPDPEKGVNVPGPGAPWVY